MPYGTGSRFKFDRVPRFFSFGSDMQEWISLRTCGAGCLLDKQKLTIIFLIFGLVSDTVFPLLGGHPKMKFRNVKKGHFWMETN